MVANRTAGLVLGDRVALGRNTFTVVGLTQHQVSSGGDPAVYVTLPDAQRLQFDLAPPAARLKLARGDGGSSRDTVNAVVARLHPNASSDSVASTIRRWKHLAAITQEAQENILTLSLVDRARRQIALFTGLLLVVSAVIIALIIYTMTMEKLKQIATLKLIGAPDRTIIGMIVQQAMALGFIGFAIGGVFIVNVQDYFPRRVVLEPDNVVILGAIVFVVCLLSSVLGVRAALSVDPATALGG
jgi:putative ABC transport system permease protein